MHERTTFPRGMGGRGGEAVEGERQAVGIDLEFVMCVHCCLAGPEGLLLAWQLKGFPSRGAGRKPSRLTYGFAVAVLGRPLHWGCMDGHAIRASRDECLHHYWQSTRYGIDIDMSLGTSANLTGGRCDAAVPAPARSRRAWAWRKWPIGAPTPQATDYFEDAAAFADADLMAWSVSSTRCSSYSCMRVCTIACLRQIHNWTHCR